MSCTAPKVSADAAFYLLAMNIGTGSIQCQLSSGQWTSGRIGDLLSGIEYSAITNDDCNLPMNANTITVNFNITEGLKDKEITCELPVTNTISDSTLNIQQLISKYITLALHEPLMLLQKVLSPQLFSTKPRVSFSFFFV